MHRRFVSSGLRAPSLLFLALAVLLSSCTTTRLGKHVGDKRLSRTTVPRDAYAVKPVQYHAGSRGEVVLKVRQKRLLRTVYTRKHREIRNREGEPWVLMILGSFASFGVALSTAPACVTEEDGVDACDSPEEREAINRAIPWYVGSAVGLVVSTLGLVWSLEDDNGQYTGTITTDGRETQMEDTSPVALVNETVSVRFNGATKRYTTDAKGRVTLNPARHFGLQSVERPRPLVASVVLPDRQATAQVTLHPKRWMTTRFRITESRYRLRTKPNTRSRIVGQIRADDVTAEHRVLRRKGDWVRITIRNRKVWVHRDAGEVFWAAPTYLNPRRLPSLAATVSLREPSGNRRLDADETAKAIVAVTNTGKGAAHRVHARVEAGNGANLRHEKTLKFGTLAPGKTASRTLRIRANRDVATRTETLTFAFREANGFAPDPVRLAFDTQRFRPPNLTVADVGIEDAGGNGQIEPGELVAVTARIRNTGQGPATGVTATVRLGENVFQGPTFTAKTRIGTLQPGAHHDVQFELFTNRRATGVPVFVDLTESYGEFGSSDVRLSLPFNTPIGEVVTTRVRPTDTATPRRTAATPLEADIWKNLPETDMDRPDAVAVVVGIRDYFNPNVPDVQFAKRDATLMRRYLTDVLGYREANILPRNPDQTMTAGALKTLLRRQLPDYLRSGSDVFVYFSGHGAPSTGDDPHAYLVPADADPNVVSDDNAYRLTQFYSDLVTAAEAHDAGALTVVLDACFTGQSGSGEMLIRQASPLTLTVENPLLAHENGTAFTASASDQVANWHPQMQHGLFTYFFLKGLKGAADANGDARITVAEMTGYLTDANVGVPYWSRRLHSRKQVPQVHTRRPEQVLVRLK